MAAARPLFAVTAAAVLMLGGCGTDSGSGTPGPATTTAVSPQFNAADVTFVRTLIAQHLRGVQLAGIGQKRASRPQMRMLAAAIVTTQTDEVTRLKGWLDIWQRPAAPPATADPALTALRTAPAASFDTAYLDLLIAQQDAAVKLARTETGAGVNPNALAFARQVDESRTAQVEQMRGYLK